MNWKIIKNESEYQKAIKRTLKIFHAEKGTAEADELALLLLLVKDYEEKYIVLPDISPLEIIKPRLSDRLSITSRNACKY